MAKYIIKLFNLNQLDSPVKFKNVFFFWVVVLSLSCIPCFYRLVTIDP